MEFNNNWIACDKCCKRRRVPTVVQYEVSHFEMCDWDCSKNFWDCFNSCEMYEESSADECDDNTSVDDTVIIKLSETSNCDYEQNKHKNWSFDNWRDCQSVCKNKPLQMSTRQNRELNIEADTEGPYGCNHYGCTDDTVQVCIRPMSPCPIEICNGDIFDKQVCSELEKNIPL